MKPLTIYKGETFPNGLTLYAFEGEILNAPSFRAKAHATFLEKDDETVRYAASLARSTDYKVVITPLPS